VSKKSRNPTVSPKPIPKASLSTQLISIWYKKLAQNGFNDIEVRNLKDITNHNSYLDGESRLNNIRGIPIKREYFIQCSRFLNEFNFAEHFGAKEADFLKIIWYLHSEGISLRGMIRYFEGAPIPGVQDGELYPRPRKYKMKRSVWFYHAQLHRILPFFNSLRHSGLSDDVADEMANAVADSVD